MLYKFKSKAAGDLILLEPAGNRLLKILGREPSPQGIFECEQLKHYMQLIEQAILEEERLLDEAQAQAEQEGKSIKRPEVTLRQRLWPMREMMRRCLAEQQPIVWGV